MVICWLSHLDSEFYDAFKGTDDTNGNFNQSESHLHNIRYEFNRTAIRVFFELLSIVKPPIQLEVTF